VSTEADKGADVTIGAELGNMSWGGIVQENHHRLGARLEQRMSDDKQRGSETERLSA